MKLIVEIKEKYHQYAPDLFSLREKYAFWNNKAGDLRKKSGGYDQMNKLQKEEFRSFLNQSSSSFDFFAPAKDIEKWIKQLKKTYKDYGYKSCEVKVSFWSKAHGFDVCNREFKTNRQYHSTAHLSFSVSMKQLKKWAEEGARYEAKKIELGHEEEKCGHSVHVLVAEDMITIWLS